jgi:hypothetical protein
MQDTAIPKVMLYGKLHATRRKRRPKWDGWMTYPRTWERWE